MEHQLIYPVYRVPLRTRRLTITVFVAAGGHDVTFYYVCTAEREFFSQYFHIRVERVRAGDFCLSSNKTGGVNK